MARCAGRRRRPFTRDPRPETRDPEPEALTGIDYTPEELGCLGLKSPWQKAADRFYQNKKPKAYSGRKIIDIAKRRAGLSYLAWLLKKMQARSETSGLRETLETFFADGRVREAVKGLQVKG